MRLVEKHIIKPGHQHFAEMDKLCFLSKNLYNEANYIIRQEFIKTSKEVGEGKRERANWIRSNELSKLMRENPDYKALPRKVSQQVLKQVDKSWQGFFKSIKEYKKHPDKFTGRPAMPKYKHKTKGRNILHYTIQAISQPPLREFLLCPSGTDIKVKVLHNKVRQARIVPMLNGCYKVEIVYESQAAEKINSKYIAGIDIGVNNLAAVTSNLAELTPLLINGRPLKSINQYFNKRKGELLSRLMKEDDKRRSSRQIERLTLKRNCKIDDYMHKATRFLADLFAKNQIARLIIGKNPHWKREVEMGKVNNQNFVQIPFNKFVKMMKYKCELRGIEVTVREEAHTSKCSFLDFEPVGHRDNYLGRRVKRGLFRSSKGILLNADINGSGNIIRKEVPDAFADGIEGVVVRPLRITVPMAAKPQVQRFAYKQVA